MLLFTELSWGFVTVEVGVGAGWKSEHPSPVHLNILYPVCPMVVLLQERLIRVVFAAVAVKPVGAAGERVVTVFSTQRLSGLPIL